MRSRLSTRFCPPAVRVPGVARRNRGTTECTMGAFAVFARAAVALVAVAISLADGKVAHAAPSARLVYLRNPGAESCPDDQAIRSAVSVRLGYDPFLAFAPATLFAEISKVGREYRARIKLVDDNNVVRGTRELAYEGENCADIIDTMALSMSIAIDPTSLMRRPEPAASPPGGPPTATATATAPEPTDRKSTRLNSSHSTLSRMPSSA